MNSFLRISEAAALALHTMGLLATDPERVFANKELAAGFQASEAHLAKVMQRLTKAGLVHSRRGPKGGFSLATDPERTSLLEVYEAAEGPMEISHCLFGQPVCRNGCIMGGFLEGISRQVIEYLKKTKLSEISPILKNQIRKDT
ncbi:RrF2 family transcriptional regulator [Dethiosulfatarculus sandiegensis]|uniref:Rrf2 family transcriptional regulator n=1 Tax=Dethiosulfatarculus sandiegensis TaxID=1429043 RepID=A0A0D2J1U0_9BACT|nr:Rrf2 family transcriptional regulator [Dethiosulfatarculus sandiegensis]KIX12189.1 Rrf2 family transcriptional regulator [Dethiosulfatarculus sandiegensis]